MALIKCPECGNEISDKAKVCIKCGYPIEEYVKNQEKNNGIDESEKQKYWCRHCYRQNEIGVDYCKFCGERLTPMYSKEDLSINDSSKTIINGGYGDVKFQEKKCPKCGGTNYHAFVEEQVIVPEKTKSTISINLNPLKPFTLLNHKQKVTQKAITKKISKFICDDCGHIFQ